MGNKSRGWAGALLGCWLPAICCAESMTLTADAKRAADLTGYRTYWSTASLLGPDAGNGANSASAVAGARLIMSMSEANLGARLEYGRGPVLLKVGYRQGGADGENLALEIGNPLGLLREGLVAGIGLQMGPMRLDYTLGRFAAERGPRHQVELAFSWGLRREAAFAQARRPARPRRPAELNTGAGR